VAAFSRDAALQQLRSGLRGLNDNTICGVHRQLWVLIHKLPEPERTDAEVLLAAAYLMGSKMNKRLVEYAKEHGKADFSARQANNQGA
jgi:hypothetical protein